MIVFNMRFVFFGIGCWVGAEILVSRLWSIVQAIQALTTAVQTLTMKVQALADPPPPDVVAAPPPKVPETPTASE